MHAGQNAGKSVCPGCGLVFVCGAAAGLKQCWCMERPAIALPSAGDASGCFCPVCLETRIAMVSDEHDAPA